MTFNDALIWTRHNPFFSVSGVVSPLLQSGLLWSAIQLREWYPCTIQVLPEWLVFYYWHKQSCHFSHHKIVEKWVIIWTLLHKLRYHKSHIFYHWLHIVITIWTDDFPSQKLCDGEKLGNKNYSKYGANLSISLVQYISVKLSQGIKVLLWLEEGDVRITDV